LHVELPDPNGSDPLLSYNLELLPPSVLLLSQLCTFSFTDIGESFPFDRSLFIALVSHPTLTSLEHDGFFHSRDTLPFDSFRRVRMQPIKLRNLRLPASLASTIETTRLLQSLISTPLLFNIHSLDLSFFDQGQNPNDRSYLSTLLSPNLQIPHLDSITLSFDQTSFFPSELYASTWLASFLARFPTLETLNLVCVDRFDHSADLIYPVIRFAESAGFNGFGEDGQVWWDDWSQFGVKHLSLGFSKSSETGQGRRLLVFKIEVEKGGPIWNGEALEHEPVEMDEDFLELLARAFPYLECIEIGGVFISVSFLTITRLTHHESRLDRFLLSRRPSSATPLDQPLFPFSLPLASQTFTNSASKSPSPGSPTNPLSEARLVSAHEPMPSSSATIQLAIAFPLSVHSACRSNMQSMNAWSGLRRTSSFILIGPRRRCSSVWAIGLDGLILRGRSGRWRR
jgi:hypothetical protein